MTDLEICNSALQKVGAEQITSLADSSKRAKLVSYQYTIIRDTLLYEYAFNFSIKRATLTADVTAPLYGYAYRFPLPADCLRLLDTNLDEAEYKIEEDGWLLTDESEIKIRYIKKVTDATKFSVYFGELLATCIAADIAYPLAQSIQLKKELKEEAENMLRKARSLNSQEGTPEELYKSSYTTTERF
jgi:hypothetical protein